MALATDPVVAARLVAMDRDPLVVDLAVARIVDLRPARAAMARARMAIVALVPQALAARVVISAGMTVVVTVAAMTILRNHYPCRKSMSH